MAQNISIFSPKGGVGRTFIATNLAVALAKKISGKKILLIDMDLELPQDMAMLLNLKPAKALVDLVPDWQKNNYSPALLNDYILTYPSSSLNFSSSLHFMPLILNPREKLNIYTEDKFLSRVLKDLGPQYDFIIADSGRAVNKLLVAFIEQANLISIVVNPDILSVNQARNSIEILESLHFPLKMMRIILNRAESLGGVIWEEVKAALPANLIAYIPSEGKLAGSALNHKIPLVLDSPRCRASVALDTLAKELATDAELFISHEDLKVIFAASPLAKNDEILKEDVSSLEAISQSMPHAAARKMSYEEKIDALKQRVHQRLIRELDLRRIDLVAGDAQKVGDLRQKTIKAINSALTEETGVLISSREDRERLVKEITDEALGLGPLEDLISDPAVTDILVNNKDQIYMEKLGKLELCKKRFVSNEQVRQIIERIIAPLGRRVDESVPMVDGRLSDGSRVNAIIPPLSLTGPTLTIRKFSQERMKVDDLERLNTLNSTMGEFLRACVLARKNIIVSGGTGSGKTTVLNMLSQFVPNGERIITIEDAAELKLDHAHWIRLESRPPNIEGKGTIMVRDLFRNSLRMRPDRIIIGECRGQETLDMLQAMNTGHDGSMTTLHANSTQDVLARMDSLILMSGIEIPLRAIREMIASSIDMIVHTARLSDGTRKITQITELTGMLDELHIGLNDIFIFHQAGIDAGGKIQGEFQATGTLPTFLDDLRKRGITFPEETFKKKP